IDAIKADDLFRFGDRLRDAKFKQRRGNALLRRLRNHFIDPCHGLFAKLFQNFRDLREDHACVRAPHIGGIEPLQLIEYLADRFFVGADKSINVVLIGRFGGGAHYSSPPSPSRSPPFSSSGVSVSRLKIEALTVNSAFSSSRIRSISLSACSSVKPRISIIADSCDWIGFPPVRTCAICACSRSSSGRPSLNWMIGT